MGIENIYKFIYHFLKIIKGLLVIWIHGYSYISFNHLWNCSYINIGDISLIHINHL